MRVVVLGATGRTGRPLVRRALAAGHEVVAFARTPSALDDPVARVLERGGRHVLDAMRDRGVDRYVVLTGAGVRTDRDPGQSIGSRVMGGLLGLVAADLLADSEAHVDDVRASGLDWTVLRAPRLTDGEATGSYELGYLDLGLGATLARADAAAAMLDVLTADPGSDGAWVGELPHVTGR